MAGDGGEKTRPQRKAHFAAGGTRLSTRGVTGEEGKKRLSSRSLSRETEGVELMWKSQTSTHWQYFFYDFRDSKGGAGPSK